MGHTSKSQADPIFQKRPNQRYNVEAGEVRVRQAASFIKAANTSHGRRYFPAAGGQMVARPFQELEGLDWTPLRTEQATKVQQGSKAQKRINASVRGLQPVRPRRACCSRTELRSARS